MTLHPHSEAVHHAPFILSVWVDVPVKSERNGAVSENDRECLGIVAVFNTIGSKGMAELMKITAFNGGSFKELLVAVLHCPRFNDLFRAGEDVIISVSSEFYQIWDKKVGNGDSASGIGAFRLGNDKHRLSVPVLLADTLYRAFNTQDLACNINISPFQAAKLTDPKSHEKR